MEASNVLVPQSSWAKSTQIYSLKFKVILSVISFWACVGWAHFVDTGNECGKRFIKCCAPVDKSERESHFVELKTDSIVGNFSEKMIKQKAFDD